LDENDQDLLLDDDNDMLMDNELEDE